MECIFCKIISGELPGKFVYKDSDMVAFHDINPKAPVHVLFLPIKHIKSLNNIEDRDRELMGNMMFKAQELTKKLGIDNGFKIVINNGKEAGQLVFHLHLHILGGWKKSPDWQV